MHNRSLIICCYLLLSFLSKAQVTLSVQVPPTGVIQKSQLWNLVLVNTGNAPVDVFVKLTLLTVSDNRPVMSAAGSRLVLNKGARQVAINDVAPVQYSYLSSMFNVDRNPDGFLPIGNFQACFTVYKQVSDSYVELTEECVPVEISPLSPPQLNTPFDKDSLVTPYPSFTWLPPTPLPLFSDLSYDMVVVEIKPGQSSMQAIQQNIPVYNASNVEELALLYPASNKALDTATWYAWRIIARNNHQLVAQSEVWTFIVKGGGAAPIPKPLTGNFILLRKGRQVSGINTVTNRTLGLKYYSHDSPHEALIRIVRADGTVIQEIKQAIVYGDNFLSYTLNGVYTKDKVYTVEVSDQGGNKYTAFFQIN